MVASLSAEWPRPMAWPSSCVSTSAVLAAPQHVPTFWFIVMSPSVTVIRRKVTPLMTTVWLDEQ
jgi:hypothetical protein